MKNKKSKKNPTLDDLKLRHRDIAENQKFLQRKAVQYSMSLNEYCTKQKSNLYHVKKIIGYIDKKLLDEIEIDIDLLQFCNFYQPPEIDKKTGMNIKNQKYLQKAKAKGVDISKFDENSIFIEIKHFTQNPNDTYADIYIKCWKSINQSYFSYLKVRGLIDTTPFTRLRFSNDYRLRRY